MIGTMVCRHAALVACIGFDRFRRTNRLPGRSPHCSRRHEPRRKLAEPSPAPLFRFRRVHQHVCDRRRTTPAKRLAVAKTGDLFRRLRHQWPAHHRRLYLLSDALRVRRPGDRLRCRRPALDRRLHLLPNDVCHRVLNHLTFFYPGSSVDRDKQITELKRELKSWVETRSTRVCQAPTR